MRIFRFWTKVPGAVDRKGERIAFEALGGSNRSIEDAARDGAERLHLIENRILRRPQPEGYEADILEEPLQRLDESNIVTRNRYGAEVLNSRDHCFADLDFLPGGCLAILFGRHRTREQQIADRVAFLEKCMADPRLQGRSIRLYETHKGLRALISGLGFAPNSEETTQFLRFLRSDWLYAILCQKQGCFRARLTPKPYRMKAKTLRVKFPRTPEEDTETAAWVEEYNRRSEKFATCRYLKTIGPEFSDEIVRFHDARTGAFSDRKLA